MQSELAAQGHPAYLLTTPTERGKVYRLRVGAFANREAAVQYAASMPSLGDSDPGPALAESIPQNLIPLTPELVDRLPVIETSLSVLAWQEKLALRSASSQTIQEAEYRVVGGPSFSAWRAFPQRDGTVIRVHSRSLWPETYETASEEERAAFADASISELAAELGLSFEQVSSFAFEGEPPFLAVVEQFDPQTGERKRLQALGQPLRGLGEDGPELQWFGDDEVPSLSHPEPLFELGAEGEGQGGTTLLENWRAVTDGDYTRLESLDGQKTWRAVAGNPLWAGSDILITQDDEDVLVYRFLTR